MDQTKLFNQFKNRFEVLLIDKNSLVSEASIFRSCSLHVTHGALKRGYTKADFHCQKILNAVYYLFKDK